MARPWADFSSLFPRFFRRARRWSPSTKNAESGKPDWTEGKEAGLPQHWMRAARWSEPVDCSFLHSACIPFCRSGRRQRHWALQRWPGSLLPFWSGDFA